MPFLMMKVTYQIYACTEEIFSDFCLPQAGNLLVLRKLQNRWGSIDIFRTLVTLLTLLATTCELFELLIYLLS